MFYSRFLQRILDRWPGKTTFGLYRFLPIFFVMGAALEFSMINWQAGEVNFLGVSWGQYLKLTTASFLSMFAGAQSVHIFYRPLDDLAGRVEEEKQHILAERATLKTEHLLDS